MKLPAFIRKSYLYEYKSASNLINATDRYYKKFNKKYPVIFSLLFKSYFLIEPCFNWILDKFDDHIYYPIYWHIKRFDIVKTGLPIRYHDPDTIMLHACFKILEDYMFEETDSKTSNEVIQKIKNSLCNDVCLTDVDKDLYDLYFWWIVEFKNRNYDVTHNDDLYSFITNFYKEQDQVMFMKLAKYRRSLWI